MWHPKKTIKCFCKSKASKLGKVIRGDKDKTTLTSLTTYSTLLVSNRQ